MKAGGRRSNRGKNPLMGSRNALPELDGDMDTRRAFIKG
jgi:hypothetical protein